MLKVPITTFYFLDFGLIEIGGGGEGTASLALPRSTDLLKRPFMTGASHCAVSVSIMAVVWLIDLKFKLK